MKQGTIAILIAFGITGAIAAYAIWQWSILARASVPAPMLRPIQQQPIDSEHTALLRSIDNNIKSQIPEGTTENRKVTITGNAVEMVTEDRYRGLNWISCDITNIGPGVLYYDVNEWTNPEHPLQAGGSVSIDLRQKGAIKKLYFSTDAGVTTEVSIDGLA